MTTREDVARGLRSTGVAATEYGDDPGQYLRRHMAARHALEVLRATLRRDDDGFVIAEDIGRIRLTRHLCAGSLMPHDTGQMHGPEAA